MYLKCVSYFPYHHHLSKHDIHQDIRNIKDLDSDEFYSNTLLRCIDKFDELNYTATQIVQVDSIYTR